MIRTDTETEHDVLKEILHTAALTRRRTVPTFTANLITEDERATRVDITTREFVWQVIQYCKWRDIRVIHPSADMAVRSSTIWTSGSTPTGKPAECAWKSSAPRLQ